MDLCPRCQERPKTSSGYCKECHAENQREWRQFHQPTDQERRRASARSYAQVYVRRGIIERQDCRVCHRPAEIHHPDYDKPLEVIWLCHQHNLEEHRRVARGGAPLPASILAPVKPRRRYTKSAGSNVVSTITREPSGQVSIGS
jgi:hypothetical protein